MELAFRFFDPPPILRVLNSFFYIPWAHGTTRYMFQNGCFGGVFLVCQVMLTILGRVSFFSSQVLCIESPPNGVAWLLTTDSRIASRHGLALQDPARAFCRRGDWEHRLWGIQRPLLVHFPMLNRDGIAISGLLTDGV